MMVRVDRLQAIRVLFEPNGDRNVATTPITVPAQKTRNSTFDREREDMALGLEKIGEMVLEVLRHASAPLSMSQIEERIRSFGVSSEAFNTFEVRGAVWRLIDEDKAEFTPAREVTAHR
jgi:hypothetical protein